MANVPPLRLNNNTVELKLDDRVQAVQLEGAAPGGKWQNPSTNVEPQNERLGRVQQWSRSVVGNLDHFA